ncbi:flagellar hook capping FlgD N-terminal domain-containing protein [Parablautia muri]|uniref:Basal-body rod modification protein FlgD n=1 Tax=Parablautia muri TaxID=2320879 RepID=A0A9X5BH33_9FIRM|nr:flagellar hook capping FlgD N-terminal domain-containing protein [Parablautia muri]NBJ93512.1 flagellar hook capping protein [Parablautia muri]
MVDAVVKNGVVEETASESSIKKAATKNSLDKDAFLQLLVAQMKYQDPLEPTSNTEYISQYATFSQVEQMQNMAATMELTRASSMVGKLVEVNTVDSAGNAKSIQGTVEYVTYENNQAFVSIDGALYSIDDVVAVIDETYQSAIDLAVSFTAAMDQLPRLEFVTLKDKDNIETLQKIFNGMTAYQQSFIDKKNIEKLQKYVERIAELQDAADANKPPEDDDKVEDGDDKVEEGGDAGEDGGEEAGGEGGE